MSAEISHIFKMNAEIPIQIKKKIQKVLIIFDMPAAVFVLPLLLCTARGKPSTKSPQGGPGNFYNIE